MLHDIAEMRIVWLRQRAIRRRAVAQTLKSGFDAEIALEEARLAEAEAARLERLLSPKGDRLARQVSGQPARARSVSPVPG